MLRKVIYFGVVAVVALFVMTMEGWTTPIIRLVQQRLGLHAGPLRGEPATNDPGDLTRPPASLEGGLVRLDLEQAAAIGLTTAVVTPQREAIRLDLPGTTAYNPDSMTRVRPRFDGLVRSVRVTLGQEVAEGDPLVELDSAALAEAKTDYQTAQVRADHLAGLLEKRRPLAEAGAISQQLWAETQEQELEARLRARVARDKLLVYGLSAEQIAQLADEDDAAKSLMTLRSPATGVVVARDVVPGNLYGPGDVLLVIAPLETLWVWAEVYERDLNLVAVGQPWEVQFPLLGDAVAGAIEYVADQVDPVSRAVKIRGSIPNPDRRYKAEMLVRTVVEVPPAPGRSVIPRAAMISIDGGDFAFVRRAEDPPSFERRPIRVDRETSDSAVVRGLEPGAVVAASGSLLLEEQYEDLRLVAGPTAAAGR